MSKVAAGCQISDAEIEKLNKIIMLIVLPPDSFQPAPQQPGVYLG